MVTLFTKDDWVKGAVGHCKPKRSRPDQLALIIGGKARLPYWQKNRTLKQIRFGFGLGPASTLQLTPFFSESFKDLNQLHSEATENMNFPI